MNKALVLIGLIGLIIFQLENVRSAKLCGSNRLQPDCSQGEEAVLQDHHPDKRSLDDGDERFVNGTDGSSKILLKEFPAWQERFKELKDYHTYNVSIDPYDVSIGFANETNNDI
ncbi:Uncharacterised protein at_DN1221 [Pycnogonum litorale]